VLNVCSYIHVHTFSTVFTQPGWHLTHACGTSLGVPRGTGTLLLTSTVLPSIMTGLFSENWLIMSTVHEYLGRQTKKQRHNM